MGLSGLEFATFLTNFSILNSDFQSLGGLFTKNHNFYFLNKNNQDLLFFEIFENIGKF